MAGFASDRLAVPVLSRDLLADHGNVRPLQPGACFWRSSPLRPEGDGEGRPDPVSILRERTMRQINDRLRRHYAVESGHDHLHVMSGRDVVDAIATAIEFVVTIVIVLLALLLLPRRVLQRSQLFRLYWWASFWGVGRPSARRLSDEIDHDP